MKYGSKRLLAAMLAMSATSGWAGDTLQEVMKKRNLTQQDLLAAAKTYVPTGKRVTHVVADIVAKHYAASKQGLTRAR